MCGQLSLVDDIQTLGSFFFFHLILLCTLEVLSALVIQVLHARALLLLLRCEFGRWALTVSNGGWMEVCVWCFHLFCNQCRNSPGWCRSMNKQTLKWKCYLMTDCQFKSNAPVSTYGTRPLKKYIYKYIYILNSESLKSLWIFAALIGSR